MSVLAIKIISPKLKNYYFVSTGSLLVFFESFHATSGKVLACCSFKGPVCVEF